MKNNYLAVNITAILSGLLFGVGLAVSDMLNPARVLAFLDIFGRWDPTLAFVMGGALLVTIPGFALITKCNEPICSQDFNLPTKQTVDTQLISGTLLFGIGWGLIGLCPGPAIAAMATLDTSVFLFCGVMLISWWATDQFLAKH